MAEEYSDEDYRLLLAEMRQAVRRDIKTGCIQVGEDELRFCEREIYPDLLWVWMPDTFDVMDRDIAALKYPNLRENALIYTNPETTINLTFTYQEAKLEPGQEQQVRNAMEKVIRQSNPTCLPLGQGCIEAARNQLAWFDCMTPAADCDIYNLFAFTSVNGRLLMITGNCIERVREDWEDLFRQILGSIRIEP